MLTYRRAVIADLPLLASMNQRLIRDERHRNRMTLEQLQDRMKRWLEADCVGAIFYDGDRLVGYAVYRESQAEVQLRHFYIEPEFRRRGIGTAAWRAIASGWPKEKRFSVEALVMNEVALAFWRSLGYRDYSITLERPAEIQ